MAPEIPINSGKSLWWFPLGPVECQNGATLLHWYTLMPGSGDQDPECCQSRLATFLHRHGVSLCLPRRSGRGVVRWGCGRVFHSRPLPACRMGGVGACTVGRSKPLSPCLNIVHWIVLRLGILVAVAAACCKVPQWHVFESCWENMIGMLGWGLERLEQCEGIIPDGHCTMENEMRNHLQVYPKWPV